MVTATRVSTRSSRTKPAVPELEGFDAFVRKLMREWKVNGMAIAIVKDGEVILSEGYGSRDVEQGLEVTPHTLMPIGSTTKTFTTAGIALLADEGLLDWDTPVRQYLPTFQLWDQFASQRMTPRDMASHRSGLPRHDLMWYGSEESRQTLFERLRHLEPSADFRTLWQYQNLMFMTLGYLTDRVSGLQWEDFVQKRIFDPLGMVSSTVTSTQAKEAPDLSKGYQRKQNKVVDLPLYEGFHAVSPAGSIVSSVADMSQWLLVHLNQGKHGEQQFLSEAQILDMHRPHMVIREGKHPELPYSSYGLGWFVEPYRGHTTIHHGGNIDGFSSMLALLPDDGVGVVVLTNMDGTPVRDIITYNVFDRFIGGEQVAWSARYKADVKELEAAGARGKQKATSDRTRATRPSHRLDAYMGAYTHPGYGSIRIDLDGPRLRATYNGSDCMIKHYHYDIFDLTFERFDLTLKISFSTDVRGAISQVSVPFEPSVGDIVFNRAPDESMTDPAFLEAFVGTYELMGALMAVEFKGDVLQISMPGGPSFELVPIAGTEFEFKGLSSVSVEFSRDTTGTVTDALINQMGTLLRAKKR